MENNNDRKEELKRLIDKRKGLLVILINLTHELEVAEKRIRN